MRLSTENSYLELIVLDDCDFSVFHSFAEYLQKELCIEYIDKINDFDTLYYIFNYKNYLFVLYYSTFDGISIYPKSTTKATEQENVLLKYFKEVITYNNKAKAG